MSSHQSQKGRLFVITGASGVGKGTVYNAILQRNSTVKKSVSATTRAPRPYEVEGVHYYFLSVEQFLSMQQANTFLETAYVYGNYYGTPSRPVYDQIDKGHNIILEIDLQGARQIKDRYNDAVWIFIVPPNKEELERRLYKRNADSHDTIVLRLSMFEQELQEGQSADYVVLNDDLDSCIDDIESIINTREQIESGGRANSAVCMTGKERGIIPH